MITTQGSAPATAAAALQAGSVSSETAKAGGEGSAEVSANSDNSAQPAKTEIESKPEDIDFSKRFKALSMRERKLLEREKTFKTEEAEFRKYQEAKKNAKINPLALLESHGLSFQQLADLVLNDGKPSAEDQIKALKEELDRDKKSREESRLAAAKDEEDRAIANHKVAIKHHVDSGGDALELTRANDAYDLVYTVIEEHYEATGNLLPIQDAAKHVEDYLEGEARKLLGLKKLAPKQAVEDKPATDVKTPTTSRQQAPNALTNKLVSAATPAQPSSKGLLSDEESKRQAAALFRQLRQQRK